MPAGKERMHPSKIATFLFMAESTVVSESVCLEDWPWSLGLICSRWCISFDHPCDLSRLISALRSPLLKIDPEWKAGESAWLISPGQMALPPSPASLDFVPLPLWFLASHPHLFFCSSTTPRPPSVFLPSFPSERGSFTFILRTLQRGGINASLTEDSSSKKTKG